MPTQWPPHPATRNQNSASTSKNPLKTRNWTFAVVRYFTQKLEFVSNILWMIVGSKEILGVKFKDSMCPKLCLKLSFESDWYFHNNTESGQLWKRISRKKVPSNDFLNLTWNINKSRSPLRNSGQLFTIKWLSISFPIRGSIINLSYTCIESFPLSFFLFYSFFILMYGFRGDCPEKSWKKHFSRLKK